MENEGPDQDPRWSPDRKWIAFNSRDSHNGVLGMLHLKIIPADGAPRELVSDPDAAVAQIQWTHDGSTDYFCNQHHTTARIYRVPVSGGAPLAITRDEAVINSFSLSNAGDRS